MEIASVYTIIIRMDVQTIEVGEIALTTGVIQLVLNMKIIGNRG
jgi:hypothetical protein